MVEINPEKIIIGTVKFGIPNYGLVTNYSNKNISNFLMQSHQLGIKHLDTAQRYGEAENIIGSITEDNNIEFKISTKIDNLKQNNKESTRVLKQSVLSSINKLKIEKIHICYLHQNDINIITDEYIQEVLLELKRKKAIEYIGASVYTKEECHAAIESNVYDYIQIPFNIIDTSIYNTFVLNYKGPIKFIARSIYLQGLLGDAPQVQRINNYKNEIIEYLNEILKFRDEIGISLSDLSRSFVFNFDNIDSYIIGTTDVNHLKTNLLKFDFVNHLDIFNKINIISKIEKPWSNPRNWFNN